MEMGKVGQPENISQIKRMNEEWCVGGFSAFNYIYNLSLQNSCQERLAIPYRKSTKSSSKTRFYNENIRLATGRISTTIRSCSFIHVSHRYTYCIYIRKSYSRATMKNNHARFRESYRIPCTAWNSICTKATLEIYFQPETKGELFVSTTTLWYSSFGQPIRTKKCRFYSQLFITYPTPANSLPVLWAIFS